MADILEQIAKTEGNEHEISLGELEKHFDEITNNEKDDKKEIAKLVKALEKNIEKKKYEIDSKGIIEKIINQDKDFSKFDKNTIKIYQLCRNLESEKAGMGKCMEIDGNIGTELIEDRIATYDENSSGLLGGESIEFDAISNKLKLITKFGIYDEVLTDYGIIDNKEKYKEFIDAKRLEHFNAFLLKNEITNPESEFKKGLTKKYPNALEDICLQYTEVGTNIVYIDYKNDDANIDYSFSLDIKSDTTPEEIIALIQKSRESYNSKIEQWEKYQEFVVEANEATKGSFADAYKNINLLLGADEYKKFSKAKFSFHDITQENIGTMQIDERGQLVIGTDKKPIFPEYDFTNIPLDIRLLVTINLSKILNEFVIYYPDNTQRQNYGTIDSVKYNVNYEKAVQTMYMELMKKENVEKFKNGTLDLSTLNSLYRERAFGYFMSELKKNGEKPANIIKNRTVDSKMFKFVEAKRDSVKENELWYVSLYYTFIDEKLGNLLKKESTTWSLDESKINTVFDSKYQWLMCQKGVGGKEITEAEIDKRIAELVKTNDRLKGLSVEQKSILLNTEVGKGLFKSAIYSKEQKKYTEVNKTFVAYEKKYDNQTKVIYQEVDMASVILSNTNGKYWYMDKKGQMQFDYKNVPDKYRKYIKWDENGVPVPHWYIDKNVAGDQIYQIKKPFEEMWVQHMRDLHTCGLTQYIEWTPPGQKNPVNMATVINEKKKIGSPFADQYCQSIMDFDFTTAEDVVRDTTWEGIMDRGYEKADAIEKDPLNGIAGVVIDVSGIVVGGIAAGVVTIVTKSPQLGALAFTATDNLVKAGGYGTLEGINYIAGTGDMGDYDNIFDAWNYGAAKGMGLLETETNQYLETSYKKDENGDLVFKDREVILAEKSLEVGSSLILFGPVGKVGGMVTKSVFNGFIFRNLEKQFGNEIAAKIFTEEISKLGEKEMLATFGKEIVTNSSKNLSHLTGFFAEVSTFTAFNAFYSPFSSGVVTYAQTGDMNQASVAAEAAWEESFSTKGLLTNFVHNVGFIGLLKGSNLLVDPMSSKIMTSAEKYKYTKSKVQADQLGSQLDVEMKKEQIEALSNENILEYMSKGAEFKGIENMKEGGFFKKTATGFEYVTPDAIPKITEINNKITQLKVEISMLMQSLAVKTESLKNVEEIQKFNDFVVKNQLEGMEVSSEIILQKRIEYCEAKIKTTEGTEKTKYEEMLETLNAQKIELATLREGYLKTIDLIEVSENGILKIKNENIQKTDTEANNVEVSTGSISEISTIVEKKGEVNGDIVSDNIIANKDWSTLTTPEIQELYIKGETAKTELGNLLKSKAITKQEYIKQLQILEKEYPTIADITSAKERDIIKKYGYEISKEKIQDYIQKLGVDIQGGGSNAQGVHEIMETNLVAVIKSEGSFVYELPQKSLMNGLTTSRVPRIVDVFLYEGKTYKIMERSPGKSVEKLSLEEIKNIPQEHYDNYVRDLKELETVGLQVDPSKASNVFYDKETGFHFIDLGIKESTISMFDNIKNLQLGKGILNGKQIQIAEKNAEYEKVFYKVYQTIFTEIQNNKPYTLETVELNGCTAATVLITNKEGKKFALSTHFPPISNFSEQQLSQIHKFLQTNKSKIGDIASVEMFAVTDVGRKNNDYQKIVDAIQQETSIQPNMHLSEYNSRDKSRANTEDLGKMNIKIDKEGNIKFIHEGKKVIQTELKDDNKKKETTRRSAVDKKIVEKNAALEDGPRLQKAEELGLDVNDAKNQQLLNALQEAHEVGQDGPGKNPEYTPGVYNYTTEQIRQKMEILKPFIDNGSITLEQVRMLFERGYLGKNAVKIDTDKAASIKIDKIETIHSEKVKNTYDEIVADIQKKIDNGIDVEKNTYMLKSMENLSQTSRTAQGVLDASASENKKFKFENITPEDAGVKALENFQKLSEYLYENRNMQFKSVAEVKIFVEKIAKEANDGILKPEYFIRDENPDIDIGTGKPKYAYTDKGGMPKAFEQFCQEFYDKINNPAIDPIELAAWVEYRVNLKDHFFADGCGKTSILLSNFILMRNNLTLPEIRGGGKERFKYSGKTQRDANRPEYNPDLEIWTEYYKTQFIMGNIYSKTMAEMDVYIKKYNESGKGIKGKTVIIGEYNNNIILINEKGELRRIEIDDGKDLKENTNVKYINPDFTKMNGEEIYEYAIEHCNEIIKQYQKDNPNDKFLVDVDMFRRYLGGEKGVGANNTHEGASFLADTYFDWLIKNNKDLDGFNKTIRFLAGGPGSGKSLASEIEKNDKFNGILDGTFKTYKNAIRNIEKATANGFDVIVDFVGRDMNDAWNEGVVKRTVEQNIFDGIKEKIPNTDLKNIKIESLSALLDGKYNEAFGGRYKEVFGENYENIATYISYTGRTVPIGVFYDGHTGSRTTLAQLHDTHPTKLRFIINGEKDVGKDMFEQFMYTDKFDVDQGGYTVTSALDNGFISEGQAKDLMIGYEKTQIKIETNKK